jgi:chromosome segregation ATPase
MQQGFTMEEIQKEFLFVRGDIDALSRQLNRVYQAIDNAVHDQQREAAEDPRVSDALNEVRELGKELVERLEVIERRLTMRARMARAAV